MTAAAECALPADLAAVFDTVWQALEAAVSDLAAPLRTPVVVGLAAGAIDGRVMVLRGCHRARSQLIFHTDLRSPKAVNLPDEPRVAVVGYDVNRQMQLRLLGCARLETTGAAVDAAWHATSAAARRNYATALPPGAILEQAGDGQPESVDESVARRYFARVIVEIAQIDWLELAASGHRRAIFAGSAQGWAGNWRVP